MSISKKRITQSDIEKHNRTMEKMLHQNCVRFNLNHPDLLTIAPKGYFFTNTNKIAKRLHEYSKSV